LFEFEYVVVYSGTQMSRDSNETPQGSQIGDPSPSQPPSNTGTANSTMSMRNNHLGYDKSSGYGSEHEIGERFVFLLYVIILLHSRENTNGKLVLKLTFCSKYYII